MAADLGINTMTVSKAYQLLKNEGFLYTDRRLGSIVHIPENEEPSSLFQEKLEDELELLSAEAEDSRNEPGRFSQSLQQSICGNGGGCGMMLFWILAITDLIMVGITWRFMEVRQPIGTDAPWRSSAGVCCIPPACSSAD